MKKVSRKQLVNYNGQLYITQCVVDGAETVNLKPWQHSRGTRLMQVPVEALNKPTPEELARHEEWRKVTNHPFLQNKPVAKGGKPDLWIPVGTPQSV